MKHGTRFKIMLLVGLALLLARTVGVNNDNVSVSYTSDRGKQCAFDDIRQISLTVDGVFSCCFNSDCDISGVQEVLIENHASNLTFKLQRMTEFNHAYYAKLPSIMISSPVFMQIKYPDFFYKGFVAVSIHRKTCLSGTNIAAGTYEGNLYIYPTNFSLPKNTASSNKDFIYCDTYYEPYIEIIVDGKHPRCSFYEYYYVCPLDNGTTPNSITINSIYDKEATTIAKKDIQQFTKLCFTESPPDNSDSAYSFYTTIYNKSNQVTLAMRHPYLAKVTQPQPPPSCLPLVYNCTYNNILMNRFNYHYTINYTEPIGSITAATPPPVEIKCNLNETQVLTRTITTPLPEVQKTLCFHTFNVVERDLNVSVTSLNNMYAISNMKIETTPFAFNIQDTDITCEFLPNTYLKIKTTIYRKNYTHFAFNYQSDVMGQNNASLIALTNLNTEITRVYMLLPQYSTDDDMGDITIDVYQGVPIFDFLSYKSTNCYAFEQIRYYCMDNVLFVSTQHACSLANLPENMNFSLYDTSGSSQELKLTKYVSVAGQNYIYNYSAIGGNKICTQQPYFVTDKYIYGGVHFFINEMFPISLIVELVTDYCSLLDPAFNFQAQLFRTKIYLIGACNLSGYCYEDLQSYVKMPLTFIGSDADTVAATVTPKYKYYVSSILDTNTPYIVKFQKCVRSDIIKPVSSDVTGLSPTSTLAPTILYDYDQPYGYFESPMLHTINWDNKTLKMVINYTKSCIEVPKTLGFPWYVQIIEGNTWGILVLSVGGKLCSSANINVTITFFAAFTDASTGQRVEQPILTAQMVVVDSLSASHKLHISDDTTWTSYKGVLSRNNVQLFANLTFKYIYFQEQLNFVSVSRVTEPCLAHTLSTRLLEIDYSTSLFEIYNYTECYMLTDFMYLVLPTASKAERVKRAHENIHEIVMLEVMLLNTYYSLEDVWAFIEHTNILDIALALEWNSSDVPPLQAKHWKGYGHRSVRRHHDTTFFDENNDSDSAEDVGEAELLIMFNMRKMPLTVNALAPHIYRYWVLTMSSYPYVASLQGQQAEDDGQSFDKTSLPATFRIQKVNKAAPNYDNLPLLRDQLKTDLNNDLATKIITNEQKFNVSGLLDARVIKFNVGKNIYYSNIPLSFYQYNNFIALVLTLGDSNSKVAAADSDIFVIQSPTYSPFQLTSDVDKTQIEIINDFFTIYCSSCVIYDDILLVSIHSVVKVISRINIQSLPVYQSMQSQISGVRRNYTYTIRMGVDLRVSNISFTYPVYNTSLVLSTQILNNTCFLDGYAHAFLKSNSLYFVIELMNCMDVVPVDIAFTLLTRDDSNQLLEANFGTQYRPLTLLVKNRHWVSYYYDFTQDENIDFNILSNLANKSVLQAVLQVLISNTQTKRILLVDLEAVEPENQYCWMYFLVWIVVTVLLGLSVWLTLVIYRHMYTSRRLLYLGNMVLANNYIMKRDVQNSFGKFMRNGQITHPLLALNVLMYDDLTLDELAECLQISPQAVERWIRRLLIFLESWKKHEEIKERKRLRSVLHMQCRNGNMKKMHSEEQGLQEQEQERGQGPNDNVYTGSSQPLGGTDNITSTNSSSLSIK